MKFLDKVRNTIETNGMDLHTGEPVLIALNGGANSMGLLFVMRELGYNVQAIHVNHNLKGYESMEKESFCYGVCANFGIELEIVSVDVQSYSIKNKLSIEASARDLKYKAFSENAKGIKKVILANSLNDCLEATVYNLTIGTLLKGLCGLAPTMYRKDLDITIFRPLIECTQEEIEDYLNEKHIGFIADSKSGSSDYTRNIIRNKVIPILAEINPSVVNTYGDTVKAIRYDSKYIDDRADRLTNMLYNHKEIDLDWLAYTEPAMLSRVLAIWLSKKHGIKVNRDILNKVIMVVKTKSGIRISKTECCVVKGNKLTIEGIADECGV